MNRLHYYLFCLWVVCMGITVTGCNPQGGSDKRANKGAVLVEDKESTLPETIQLSVSKNYEHEFKFTDMVADVNYIPLETYEDYLLGNRTGLVRVTENFIFVASDGILFRFDRQGKFVGKINKIGQGPRECSVNSVGIDEQKQRIYIFDMMKQSITIFDFEGNFLWAFKHPFTEDSDSPSSISCDKRGNILFTFMTTNGQMKYKYVAVNDKGEILYQCPNYDRYDLKHPVRAFSVSSHPIYEYNTFSYYPYLYNDTVFCINDDYSCSPAWIIRLPDRITLEESLKACAYVTDWSTLSGKNYLDGIREDQRKVYIYRTRCAYPEKTSPAYLSIYDKQTKQLTENINPLLKNDWDGGMDIDLTYDQQKENVLYKLLQPFEMKERLTDNHFSKVRAKYPDKQKSLQTMINTVKEDDNPVVMIITLK